MTEPLTPESLAELQRLLDANEAPWSAHRPSPNYARYEIRDHRGYDLAYTVGDALGDTAELIAAAVNALPALLDAAGRLAEVEAERDALAAKVDRVRALHRPRTIQVLGAACSAEVCDHDDCPLVDYTVCDCCYAVCDGASRYAYEDGGIQDVAYPCPTFAALDHTPVETLDLNPGLSVAADKGTES